MTHHCSKPHCCCLCFQGSESVHHVRQHVRHAPHHHADGHAGHGGANRLVARGQSSGWAPVEPEAAAQVGQEAVRKVEPEPAAARLKSAQRRTVPVTVSRTVLTAALEIALVPAPAVKALLVEKGLRRVAVHPAQERTMQTEKSWK